VIIMQGLEIFSGEYGFFVDGSNRSLLARFTFVMEDGKAIHHHSSVNP